MQRLFIQRGHCRSLPPVPFPFWETQSLDTDMQRRWPQNKTGVVHRYQATVWALHIFLFQGEEVFLCPVHAALELTTALKNSLTMERNEYNRPSCMMGGGGATSLPKTPNVTSGREVSPLDLSAETEMQCEKPFECTICGASYKHKWALTEHLGTHLKPFGCDICGKEFNKKVTLTYHLRVHTGEQPIRRPNYGKSYQEKIGPSRHLQVGAHDANKPFGCTICGLRFQHKWALTEHFGTHAKPFECDICGKQFNKKVTLTYHLRVHNGGKPFECTVCGMRFEQKGALTEHVAVHTGGRTFKCTVCGESFQKMNTLREHIRAHTGEKLFERDGPSKGFDSNSHLRKNLGINTGRKPFECKVCGKSFNQMKILMEHLLVHTGEKPVGCTVCNKRFSDKKAMKKHHNRMHAAEKPAECNVPGQGFNQN